MQIQGTCQTQFKSVREEFERNFSERGEVGGSVSVIVEGQTVVDLWGGVANTDTGMAWGEDTVSLVFSCTKGATAFCAHVLAARGLLDLDAPVSAYWPGFAKAGKEEIPVKMLLNHQAGLPGLRSQIGDSAFYNWDGMVKALEKEEPFWEPGTQNGYHGFTFGWLVGEVVRQVSGQSLGAFFQQEIAGPLGLDFWIGLPEGYESRVAPLIASDMDPSSPFFVAMADKNTVQSIMFVNSGGYMSKPDYDSPAAHAAQIGGAGGITNGRGLAGMYAPLACGGSKDGTEYVDRDTLSRMGAISSATGRDVVLLIPSRFSLGFMKTMDNRKQPQGYQDSVIMGEDAFGHAGLGGSLGFADPGVEMSFGYTMNSLGQGTGLNERGQSLVDAAYRSLGCTSNASGGWQ